MFSGFWEWAQHHFSDIVSLLALAVAALALLQSRHSARLARAQLIAHEDEQRRRSVPALAYSLSIHDKVFWIYNTGEVPLKELSIMLNGESPLAKNAVDNLCPFDLHAGGEICIPAFQALSGPQEVSGSIDGNTADGRDFRDEFSVRWT